MIRFNFSNTLSYKLQMTKWVQNKLYETGSQVHYICNRNKNLQTLMLNTKEIQFSSGATREGVYILPLKREGNKNVAK